MHTGSESQAVSHRIVTKVADAKGVPPAQLSPLAESIDPDALNAIFSHTPKATTELRFEYEGYTVRVDEHGEVALSTQTPTVH